MGTARSGGQQEGPTRLGFVLMLQFFELKARFPRHAGEIRSVAVDYLAFQVEPEALADYR